MARIRTIKPELWQDEQLGTLPPDVLLLFIGLISHADDDGRLRGNYMLVRAQVFPYRPDVDVAAGLETLESAGHVVRYTVGGQSYLYLPNFRKHQRIDKPKPSALPPPPTQPTVKTAPNTFGPPPPDLAEPVSDESKTHPRRVADESQEEGKGMEGKGTEEEGSDPPPPVPQVAERVVPEVIPPDTPPSAWTGEDFWRWAQGRRQAAGLLPERRRPRDLGGWYSGVLMTLGGNVEALQEAFYRFGENEFWQRKDPPLPFAGFASQWDRFVPPGVNRASA